MPKLSPKTIGAIAALGLVVFIGGGLAAIRNYQLAEQQKKVSVVVGKPKPQPKVAVSTAPASPAPAKKKLVILYDGDTYALPELTYAARNEDDYATASRLANDNDNAGLKQLQRQGRLTMLSKGVKVIYRDCAGVFCAIAIAERVSDRQRFFIPRKSLTGG